MQTNFRALRISENADGSFTKAISELELPELLPHYLSIQVLYSSVNYKDALSSSGNKGVTKNYPHTPGIDAVGIVSNSHHPDFASGDYVIVTGYDLGMNTNGGYGEFINVPAEWAVPLPKGLSPKETMILGTAGFTAALSVHKLLQNGMSPESGEVLVTGASGGVGSIAVALLSHLGFSVIASTGKVDESDWLRQLGATKIIPRSDIAQIPDRPLVKSMWAGVVDTVGGETLANVLKATAFGGSVTTCGNVSDFKLNTTVYPFILNSVNLLGIASAMTPMAIRKEIWSKLSGPWHIDFSQLKYDEVQLEDLPEVLDSLLNGSHIGRTVVKIKP